jgi:cytochrome P450
MMASTRPWPWLGHLPWLRADSTGFLQRIAREQGDVARFRIGARPAFLFTHPDDVRSILIDHADSFRKGDLMQRARRLLGDGLLTSEGDKHRLQRRRIMPVFATDRIAGYAADSRSIAHARAAAWQPGALVQLNEEMDALSMSVVSRTLLGSDVERDLPALGAALRRLAKWAPLLAAPGGRMLERTRLPVLRRLRAAIELVESVIDRNIADGGERSPLVAALLKHGNTTADAVQIRDEVMTIFLAGHDTTAAALMWTWLLLGTNREVERQVHEEAIAAPSAGMPANLPFTDAVVREVLRLYPPISRIGRRPEKAIEIRGTPLDTGCSVFVSPFVTQRDERFFVAAETFRPERWLVDPPPVRFAWFPFGAGARSCIGEHFARQAIVLAVTTIARQWRLEPTRSALPRARSLLTLKPRGRIQVRVEPY